MKVPTLKLPPAILSMLKKRGGKVDVSLRASRKTLTATCGKYGCALFDSVMAFESAFGGLIIPDGPKMKKDEPHWIFGTHACLTSESHSVSKSRKFVPVVYSPNDIIYYLNKDGKAYAEDTIEDTSASLYAENGTALVCRIVIDDILFSRKETSLELSGLQGDLLSKDLKLTLITKASGKDRRFFANTNGDILIAEDIKAKRTVFAGATAAQLKLVKKPAVPGAEKATKEMLPFLGKDYVRMVGEQRTSIPDFFEHLPELRNVDISINKLASLPDSLWRATQITDLDLSFNPLKTLPDGIANLKNLRKLSMRGCPFETLPEALAELKNLTQLVITECEKLDVDAALKVIAKLPKLKDLWIPLSRSLTTLAPLATLPLKSLFLNGTYVKHPDRLPPGLSQLKKLTDLRIDYADDIALLPEAPEDVKVLRLIFSKKFTDDDIRRSAAKQPEVLYLKAYAGTL